MSMIKSMDACERCKHGPQVCHDTDCIECEQFIKKTLSCKCAEINFNTECPYFESMTSDMDLSVYREESKND